MDNLEKLKFEKELLGFFLSGHPVDTLLGLGPLVDTLRHEELADLTERRSFRLCGVVSEVERRYTKKDSKPWARFNLLAKEKDLSLPMFPEMLREIRGTISRRRTYGGYRSCFGQGRGNKADR